MKDAGLNGHPGVFVWSGDGILGCFFSNTEAPRLVRNAGLYRIRNLTAYSARAKELAAGTMGCEYGV